VEAPRAPDRERIRRDQQRQDLAANRKLAAQVPGTDAVGSSDAHLQRWWFDGAIHRLHPAHGPPVAEPGRLSGLKAALDDIEMGRVSAEIVLENRRLFLSGTSRS
jgi:hypothetical protein